MKHSAQVARKMIWITKFLLIASLPLHSHGEMAAARIHQDLEDRLASHQEQLLEAESAGEAAEQAAEAARSKLASDSASNSKKHGSASIFMELDVGQETVDQVDSALALMRAESELWRSQLEQHVAEAQVDEDQNLLTMARDASRELIARQKSEATITTQEPSAARPEVPLKSVDDVEKREMTSADESQMMDALNETQDVATVDPQDSLDLADVTSHEQASAPTTAQENATSQDESATVSAIADKNATAPDSNNTQALEDVQEDVELQTDTSANWKTFATRTASQLQTDVRDKVASGFDALKALADRKSVV